jgi:PKD repeat protein
MSKKLTKALFILLLLAPFVFTSAVAQTITIGAVDPGPYGIGSTIAIPFHVNDASGCVQQSNVYSLYLCNAAGTPVSGTAAATITNFYGTFFNYTGPVSTVANTYTFIIKSSNPAVTSNVSNTFTISAIPGTAAAATCPSNQISNAQYPQVFGSCSGANNTVYTFANASVGGASATATFFNELTQAAEVTNTSLAPSYNFTAKAANYTVTVRSVNSNNAVSTYAYQLINNVVNSSIGATGNPSVCLAGGTAPLTYNIDVSSPTGIQFNYPGNTYTFSWGDGTPNSIFTLCQIEALGGKITHDFTKSSCGITSNNNVNSFEIDFQSDNLYCGKIGSAPSNYAKIFTDPLNKFSGPVTACTGSTVSFVNASTPGPDPNATTSSCNDNPNALYSWSVDGIVVESNYHLGQNFVTTFTEGTHTINLHLQNPGTACIPTDFSQTICVQNPPEPSFTLPQTTVCISSGPVVPTNTSVIDASCNTQNTYLWTATPSAGVTFNATVANPQFTFTNIGVYQIGLTVTTASCGPVTTPTQTLTVNSSPVAVLSADFSACGNNQTLKFDANATNNPTYTNLSGTAVDAANTYTWTVTGGTYSFAAGSTANSKYPNITFNDYATYTVTVTQQNNCGSITSLPQHITFQQAPTVSAGNDFTICATAIANLNGQVTGTGVTNYQWTGGTGTFTPNVNALNATYQPSAAEISAGKVTLTLEATTSVAAPCNLITSPVTITISPIDVINSKLTTSICSNTKVNYKATSPDATATFTWTATLVSGSATGFSPTGSGSLINDLLVNTDPTASTNAVIAYIITPTNASGCTGTPSTLNVTVTPLPLITATAANASICSSQPADITLTSSVTGTSYTWTSATTGPITGNTNNSIPANVTSIADILINSGTTQATVTYTITPISTTGCAGTPVKASVIVQPSPIVANAGSNASICDVTTFTLNGNSPAPGTGKWTVTPNTGITFTDATSPTSGVNGLVPGNTYQFTWTITSAPGCSNANSINITVNSPTIAGTTSTPDQSIVCAGSNNGEIVLTGSLGTVINWETSIDNGVTWAPVTPVNNGTTLFYTNLTQTTQYRAILQNGACNVATSNATIITVNQPAVKAYAGPPANLCNVTTYVMQGNDPGTFAAQWTQLSGPTVTFSDPTKYNTTISNLQEGNVYTFSWTIQAVSPCASSQDEVVVTDAADVVPSFTADKTDFCGQQNVTFTNTSNNQAGASFSWDFGDGTPPSSEVSPQHIFIEDPTGKDITYTVTLTVLKNCNAHPAATQTITVRPAIPDAEIAPTPLSGCGPTTFTIQNMSTGDNDTYIFYVKDAQGNNKITPITKTDKSSVTFTLSSPITANYTFYMTATNKCGTVNSSAPIYIPMAPQDIAAIISSSDNKIDCFPFTASLVNASGGSSYSYTVTNPDGTTTIIPAVSGPQPYAFPQPGTYTIQLFASDACSQNVPSNILTYTIYPPPAPDFTSAIDCGDLATFTNITPDPNNLYSYSWDFGDGSTPSPNPIHQYTYDPQHTDYKVTLTATNTSTNCSNSISHDITISPLLTAQFEVLPATTISIPDYHFNFVDQSSGPPTAWLWDFGDGETSSERNPGHTYAYGSVGDHIVTLMVSRATCPSSTFSQTVTIIGVPGQLYMPNAFIPDSRSVGIEIFIAKGAGIKTWLLQIFNNYGQLIWQTTKLDNNGSPVEGWDGTFKGAPAPQGTYIWQASATFINGSEWKGMSYNNSLPKRTGTVNLIR